MTVAYAEHPSVRIAELREHLAKREARIERLQEQLDAMQEKHYYDVLGLQADHVRTVDGLLGQLTEAENLLAYIDAHIDGGIDMWRSRMYAEQDDTQGY